MNGYITRADSQRLLLLSRIAKVVIGLYLAVWGLETLASGVMLALLSSNGLGTAAYAAAFMRGFGMVVGALVFLPSALCFLIWFHKAIANLHDAGLSGLVARPGWSVGSFFVPGPNLFVPFRAMRELWNRSHGEDEWQGMASVGDVGLWWMGFIAGTSVVFIIDGILVFDFFTNISVVTPPGVNETLATFGTALWCLSALFLYRIIDRITAAQQRLSDDRLAFL